MKHNGKQFNSYYSIILSFALLAALLACSQEQQPPVTETAAPKTVTMPVSCDRQCLESFIDQYLAALVKHDPSGLPLADDVVFVENDQRLQMGDGTWRTITGMGKYRHYFADPTTGQVAVMTVLEENGNYILYDLRLAIDNKKISEIEAMVIRAGPGAKLVEDLGTPWPEFTETIPPEQRVSREQLVATANKYLSGMENNNPNGDYSFFDPECDRLEHGIKTTRNKPTEYGHSTDKEFVTMTCREQFETGFLGFVTRIRDRRYVVVDEERQTVFGLVVLDHNGTIRKINMSNNRVFVIPPYFSTPRTLHVGEAWRIRGDKLYKIEMTLNEFPYGTRPQFDRDGGGWLEYSGSNQSVAEASNGTCDRSCLETQLDNLLQAMLAHDPDRLPLATSIRYTENGQRLAPGDGLWGTLTGLGDYKLVLADEQNGLAGFYGTIIETDVPGVLTVRLMIEDNRITQIEAVVYREEKVGERGGTLTLMAPRLPLQFNPEQFLKNAPSYPEQTVEADLQAVVDQYSAGIDGSTTVAFAADCRRRVNGVTITDNPGAGPVDPDVPAYLPYSMSCAEQLRAGAFKNISRIRDRRTLLADASHGLLLELAFYDVANPAMPVQVASVGEVKFPPTNTGPYTMMTAQIYHIVNGEIAGIESMSRPVPYGMSSGW